MTSSRFAAAVLTTALTASLSLPAGGAASGTVGAHTVTAKHGANVRKPGKDGRRTSLYIGHLAKGDAFTVASKRGAYCFGRAGGHVDRSGWVLCASLS